MSEHSERDRKLGFNDLVPCESCHAVRGHHTGCPMRVCKKRRRGRMGTRFNRWWVALWAVNTVALAALLIASVTPLVYMSAALGLFFIPEGIGLLRRGDSLPPLTHAIRRYVPRWMVNPVIGAGSAWAIIGWWERPHHVIITLVVCALVGWLFNHFDVTYDSQGE